MKKSFALSLLLLCGLSRPVPAAPTTPVRNTPQIQPTTDKPLAAMSEAEINHWLKQLSRKPWLERLELVSARALGTPYKLGPLGEGPNAPYDRQPLINLQQVDCVTFCEQSLALALAPDYKEAFKILQKIRYQRGEIKMECRNHYFMADWIPNNHWLVADITPHLPGALTLERTISHKTLFANQKFEGLQVRQPDRTLKIKYVPEDQLEKVLPLLKSGDIGVLIQNRPGIFAAHTGLVIRKGQQLYLRNATSLAPEQVVDTPFGTLIESLKKSQRLIGMSFARPHLKPRIPAS
jgi:hypothetical protein